MDISQQQWPDPADLEFALRERVGRETARLLIALNLPVLSVDPSMKTAAPGEEVPLTTLEDDLDRRWPESPTAIDNRAVACVPGDANLLVITVDKRPPAKNQKADCWAAEEAWQRTTGVNLFDQATIVTETPSGGRHYWFACKEPMQPTHAEKGVAIKSGDAYVIVHGGLKPYKHTLKQSDWTHIDIPEHVRPSRGEQSSGWVDIGPRNNQALAERYDRLCIVDLDMSTLDQHTNEARRRMFQAWDAEHGKPDSDPRSAAAFAAKMSIHWVMSEALRGSLLYTHSAEIIKQSWLLKWEETYGADYGARWEAVAEVEWSHIYNIATQEQTLWPPDDLSTADADSDKQWQLLKDTFYDESLVPKEQTFQDILGDVAPSVIISKLSGGWDISANLVRKGLNIATDEAESKNAPLTFADVHRAIFGKPEEFWLGSPSRVNVPRVVNRLAKLTEFRYSQSDELYRYHAVGPLRGLWASDGKKKGHLYKLLSILLVHRYQNSVLSEISHALISEAQPIATEDDPSSHQNPQLIAFRNGVLDWQRNSLREPSPDDHITALCPFDWVPQATCEIFDTYLEQSVEKDAHQLVYEIIGVCLHAGMPVKSLIFLIGETNSGKSVLIKVIEGMLGGKNYSSVTPQAMVTDTFAASELYLKRANLAGDISSTAVDDPGMLKMLSGSDTITAQKKHRDHFRFRPNAMQIYSMNEMLKTKDTTEAWFKRVVPVVFPNSIPEEEQIDDLPDQIKSPDVLAGIAVKAVRALARVVRLGRFTLPESSIACLAEYQQDMQPIAVWAQERLEPAPENVCLSNKSLYDDYAVWCKRSGHRQPSRATFIQRLPKWLPEGAEPSGRTRQKRFAGIPDRYVSGANWVGGVSLASDHDFRDD